MKVTRSIFCALAISAALPSLFAGSDEAVVLASARADVKVVAALSTIQDAFDCGLAPTALEGATLLVDDVELTSATGESLFYLWAPSNFGNHKLTHRVGDIDLDIILVVSSTSASSVLDRLVLEDTSFVSVVANNSSITTNAMSIGYAPTRTAPATVTIGISNVVSRASVSGLYTWTPSVYGNVTLCHQVGSTILTASYIVDSDEDYGTIVSAIYGSKADISTIANGGTIPCGYTIGLAPTRSTSAAFSVDSETIVQTSSAATYTWWPTLAKWYTLVQRIGSIELSGIYSVREVAEPTPPPTPATDSRLAPKEDGVANFATAQVYQGCLLDDEGHAAGVIQIKAARQKTDKKTRLTTSKLTITIQIPGEKKQTVKGVLNVATGTFVATLKDGRELNLKFGSNGVTGTFDGASIDGARDLASSKVKAEKSAAETVINKLKKNGAVMVAWQADDGKWNGLSLTVGTKGKTKVSGTLANGTKVSTSTTLIIGEEACLIPVTYTKKGTTLAFNVWLTREGEITEVTGLGDEAIYGSAAALPAGATLQFNRAHLVALLGAGASYDLSTLKISYKAKTGTFKGTFKASVPKSGRMRSTKVTVSGVVVDGVGYGQATYKKNTIPVQVK